MIDNILNEDKLFGFEKEKKIFLDSYNSGRMHHAWLISGPQGIGKSKFAQHLAKFLLSSVTVSTTNLEFDNSSPASHKVDSQSHPDLLILDSNETEKGRIGVEETREIGKFLSLTAVESKYKVVIIDSVDDMNRNSANALLKLLEEPTKNVIFLVICHQLGKVIPTVRSRCRLLKVLKPNEESFVNILIQSYPSLTRYDAKELYLKSNGSLTSAHILMDADNSEIFDRVEKTIQSKDKADVLWLVKSASNDEKWKVIQFALEKCLHSHYINMSKSSSVDVNASMEKLQTLKKMIAEIDLFHLDKGQVLISVLS